MRQLFTALGAILIPLCICGFCLMFYSVSITDYEGRVIPTPTPTVSPTPTMPPVDAGLKEQVEKAFIDGCNEASQQNTYCQCAFDYLYSKFGVNIDKYSTYINEAASECLYLYEF